MVKAEDEYGGFFLCHFPSLMSWFKQLFIQFLCSSFAEFFVIGCLIMISPFQSFLLLCLVLICGCKPANLSSIHDASVYSKTCLHKYNTHHCVYFNSFLTLIFFRGFIEDIRPGKETLP